MVTLLVFLLLFLMNFICLFWLRRAACGSLVPLPGIEPASPTVEVQSLNHWTTREVPHYLLMVKFENKPT